MNKKTRQIERRQQARFTIQDGASYVLNSRSKNPGEIINLGRGGLAFCYMAGEEWAADRFELNILFGDANRYLAKVPFLTVADFEITSGRSQRLIVLRRRCIRFAGLGSVLISQIEDVIVNHLMEQSSLAACPVF